jgi:hypothetical protein
MKTGILVGWFVDIATLISALRIFVTKAEYVTV